MPKSCSSPLPIFTFATALFLSITQLNAIDWRELSQDELQRTECPTDSEADGELLYTHYIQDNANRVRSYKQAYFQFKVYTELGVKMLEKRRVHYNARWQNQPSIKARIIKTDGTIVEYDKDDFYKQKDLNSNGESYRSITFASKGLEVGDVFEYQYSIHFDEGYYVPRILVDFQEPWPLQKAFLQIKPSPGAKGNIIKWMTSRIEGKGMKRKGDGFYELTVKNVPAFRSEPYGAPKKKSAPWVLFYYTYDSSIGDTYWKKRASEMVKLMDKETKSGDKINETLERILKGASSDEDKLSRIHNFCTSEIRNSRFGPKDSVTKEERKKIKENDKAETIIDRGFAGPRGINVSFCALARAAGFDARYSRVGSRNGYRFSKKLTNIDLVLPSFVVAVKIGDDWKPYDPGARFLAPQQLDQSNQQSPVLIADKKDLILLTTGVGRTEDSMKLLTANLEIDENGLADGNAEILFHGYQAVRLKRQMRTKGQKARTEFARKNLKNELEGATLSNITISGADDPIAPVSVKFEVSDFQLADRVGDRLIVPPNVFAKGKDPKFVDTQRHGDIFFGFAEAQKVEVHLKLPESMALEEGNAPQSNKSENLYEYSSSIGIKKKSNTLVYKRTFWLNLIHAKAEHYRIVKTIFDFMYNQDQHALVFSDKTAS